MDSTNKLSAEVFGIYAAANKLVAQIGMIGAVDSSDPAVEDCMAALHALDGGNVARRVEDLTEKAFMPHNQASRLAVDEYIAIASAISPQLVASECRPTLAEFGALRQFKHNDGSDGFVAAYDKEATDLYISSFAAPQVVADERAYTAEEAREQFMDQVRHLVRHWERESRAPTAKEKLEGLAFSIMNIFDGTSGLPAFDIVCAPHPDDKQYHIDEGSKYFMPGMVINECHLHEMLFSGRAAAPVQEQEPDNEWRRLALQFDDHRMQAIGHLKCMVEDAAKHKRRAEEFLSARPLSGEAVLAERIKALAPVQPVAVPGLHRGYLLGRSIIHECPALVLPRSFIQKLGGTAQIIPLRGMSDEAAKQLVRDCNSVAPAAQGDAKDAERLRWMAESGARVSWSMDGEYCAVWLPDERDGTESRPAEGYPLKCYDSWHRAIDAAIAAKAAS